MGWLGKVFAQASTRRIHVDEDKAREIRRREGELALALTQHDRTIHSVHRDLAEGVLAEVMKGRQ